jgi:hypothetical protein
MVLLLSQRMAARLAYAASSAQMGVVHCEARIGLEKLRLSKPAVRGVVPRRGARGSRRRAGRDTRTARRGRDRASPPTRVPTSALRRRPAARIIAPCSPTSSRSAP